MTVRQELMVAAYVAALTGFVHRVAWRGAYVPSYRYIPRRRALLLVDRGRFTDRLELALSRFGKSEQQGAAD